MVHLLKIESAEQLHALAEAAGRTFDEAERLLLDVLTPERCAFVRRLRVDEDHSWRAVATVCHETWGASWEPPSNQLWGMALCKLAALAHGEDYMSDPWN